jgi:glycosyltransferase involved in cell wall biosynthesis
MRLKMQRTTRLLLPQYTQRIPAPQPSTAAVPQPDLVMITTYPPRACGLATFASDLIEAIQTQYEQAFTVKICALDVPEAVYPAAVFHVLQPESSASYHTLLTKMGQLHQQEWVIVQHEFGLFRSHEFKLLNALNQMEKKVMVVLHTVLAHPDEATLLFMKRLGFLAHTLVVMTAHSQKLLVERYGFPASKIIVIPHGTHLVDHLPKAVLKKRMGWEKRTLLTTFGLLSSGKNIETTLEALPLVIQRFPEVLFLIVGKTHPGVVAQEGERYRHFLEERITALGLQHHTHFINEYVALPKLLDLLQMTDIYLFTSKNQEQAVSGTFAYALSCGCPIITTPIPHARELVQKGSGLLFDFEKPVQLARQLIALLAQPEWQEELRGNGLHQMEPTAWENTAMHYVNYLKQQSTTRMPITLRLPNITLKHVWAMTTGKGILQFARLNQPDTSSGYTLDDNARALIVTVQNYQITRNPALLTAMERYLQFMLFCLQPDGRFLNYVSYAHQFTAQNKSDNLEDSFGRAIWALGYCAAFAPADQVSLQQPIQELLQATRDPRLTLTSPRAMAFTLKGLYFVHESGNADYSTEIEILGDRLQGMYGQTATENWPWYEPYLTYGNSVLPEALLMAWKVTHRIDFKTTAVVSFSFLLSILFRDSYLRVISNNGWFHRGQAWDRLPPGGEQPIDAAYTVLALDTFQRLLQQPEYAQQMETAYRWFLGLNHRGEMLYNPKTGGCYDGLEADHVNLNQGAESTLSHLLARQALELHQRKYTKQLQNQIHT